VVQQHARRGAGGGDQRPEPVGQAVRQGVLGAGVEEPLPDLRLRSSAHVSIVSRNNRYVYRPVHAVVVDVQVVMRVVFVHGACVRDGSWWWHRTAELLAERGVPSVAPALPSCGEAGGPGGVGGGGLTEDVTAVRRALLAADEPTVVVAHSYGGIVASAAAAGIGWVRHLLLVSSYLPEVGQSLSDFGDDAPAPFLDVDPDAGTFGVRPELLVDTFLHDCDAEVQAQAAGHLARQSLQVIGQPVTAAAWQQVPSTYLVCARDRGTPPHRQREFARRAGAVVEIDAGHHPFLSRPDAVRDLLLDLADEPGRHPGGQEAEAGAEEELLRRAYAAFNSQDLDALLALVSEDVDWPDGARRLRGAAAVRAHWTEQWVRTHTHDEPVAFTRLPDGRTAVLVEQVVRSLDGSVLARRSFRHVHRIADSRILRLDTEDV
jgi:pimeloyl-ACP methyl ester carboxylesterase/ketosteroid isomerase-like protein